MLHERIRTLREGTIGRGPIAYWMSRDQRVQDNWAFILSQELAMKEKAPLLVVFCLVPRFLNATMRHYAFMLSGLKKVSERLNALNIPFFLFAGEPGDVLPGFVAHHAISALVTDFDPLRVKRQWKGDVARSIRVPFFEVDAHNVVPCNIISSKQEYSARTIRSKFRKVLPVFLDDFPKAQRHPFPWTKDVPLIRWEGFAQSMNVDGAVKEVDWITPGEDSAQEMLEAFIHTKLESYEMERNDPTRHGQSNLSPYLHFGQLSAQRVALEASKASLPGQATISFLEELIVRRELSDNFCFYNPRYDGFDGFPQWAQRTLNEHRKDRRPYLYTREELECSGTHDDLWNACQMEMVKRGKMHGYLRMYWAKKILEWTLSPEDAIDAAIYLNDRYELDGRDPNGYAGIAWSMGGVHDRAWKERNVFGKIRYMSYNGCKSKFNVKAYIEQISGL